VKRQKIDWSKNDDAISGRLRPEQLDYVKKSGVSAERFARVARLGRVWTEARLAERSK
jgi:hypothetical protein